MPGHGWPGGEIAAVFGEMAQLGKALLQVVQGAGSPAQVAGGAAGAIGDTRRRLYGILATDTHAHREDL